MTLTTKIVDIVFLTSYRSQKSNPCICAFKGTFFLVCRSLSYSSLAYVSIQRGLFKGFQGSALRVLDCALKQTVFQLTFVSKDVRLTIRASQSSPSVLLVELKSKRCHKKYFFDSSFFMVYTIQYKY